MFVSSLQNPSPINVKSAVQSVKQIKHISWDIIFLLQTNYYLNSGQWCIQKVNHWHQIWDKFVMSVLKDVITTLPWILLCVHQNHKLKRLSTIMVKGVEVINILVEVFTFLIFTYYITSTNRYNNFTVFLILLGIGS